MESSAAPTAALELTLPASLEAGPFYDPFEKPFARRSEPRKRARTDDGVFTVPPSPREFSFAGVDIGAVSRVVVSRQCVVRRLFPPTALRARAHTWCTHRS